MTYIPPREIMIEKGDRVECKRSIIANGIEYFTQNEFYNCPETNCLTANTGEDLFVQADYLPYFYLKF